MANTSFVKFPLKRDIKLTGKVNWAVLDKPDPGPTMTPKPNHQITMVVSPEMEAELASMCKEIGNNKGVHGIKTKTDGTNVLTAKSYKYTKDNIQKFGSIGYDDTVANPQPVRRGDTVTITVSPGVLTTNNKVALYLKHVEVHEQPDRTTTQVDSGTSAF